MQSFSRYSICSALATLFVLMLLVQTELFAQNPFAFVYGGYYSGTQDSEMNSEGVAGTVDRESNYINVATFTGGIYPDPNSGYRLFNSNEDVVDMVLAKYDRRGRMRWAKQIGSAYANEYPHDVETDPDGNIYVSGSYGLSSTRSVEGNFDPDGVDSLPTQDYMDAFLAKYDADGNYLWAFNLGRPNISSSEVISDIAIDDSGNVFVVGIYTRFINFNPRGEEIIKSHGGGPSDKGMFVARYDSEGLCQWVCPVPINFGSTISSRYPSCGVDGAGNVYVAGNFNGDDVNFNPCVPRSPYRYSGVNDMFLVKYNPDSGAMIWLKHFRGSANSLEIMTDMAVHPSGAVAITGFLGSSSGTVDIDPSPSNELLFNHPSHFYAVCDSSGALTRAVSIPSPQGDGSIYAIAFDSTGRILLAGLARYRFGAQKHSNKRGDAFVAWYGDTAEIEYAFNPELSTEACWARDVTVDRENNVIITGRLNGREIDVDPGEDTLYLSPHIWTNCFIAKYTGDGALWKDLDALSAPDWVDTDTGSALQFVQSRGGLDIFMDEDPSTKVEVILYDAMGREVVRAKASSNDTRLDLSNLPSGFYIAIVAENERVRAAKKILVN